VDRQVNPTVEQGRFDFFDEKPFTASSAGS
jgi:hypothetical protein